MYFHRLAPEAASCEESISPFSGPGLVPAWCIRYCGQCDDCCSAFLAAASFPGPRSLTMLTSGRAVRIAVDGPER